MTMSTAAPDTGGRDNETKINISPHVIGTITLDRILLVEASGR